jgi:transcription initiation factor IIE alpha subunit
MTDQTRVRERTIVCVDCESRITLNAAVNLGQELVCPLCDAVMEIVGLDPLEADWIYEEPEYDQDEDEEIDW